MMKKVLFKSAILGFTLAALAGCNEHQDAEFINSKGKVVANQSSVASTTSPNTRTQNWLQVTKKEYGDSGVIIGLQAATTDGGSAAVQWQQTSGPAATILNASEWDAKVLLPTVTTPTALTFEITATRDGETLRATQTVTALPLPEQATLTTPVLTVTDQTLELTLSEPIPANSTLNYSVLGGTAQAGRDFNITSNSLFTADGQTLIVPFEVLPAGSESDVYTKLGITLPNGEVVVFTAVIPASVSQVVTQNASSQVAISSSVSSVDEQSSAVAQSSEIIVVSSSSSGGFNQPSSVAVSSSIATVSSVASSEITVSSEAMVSSSSVVSSSEALSSSQTQSSSLASPFTLEWGELPNGTGIPRNWHDANIATDNAGTWVLSGSDGTAALSVDNGVHWSLLPDGLNSGDATIALNLASDGTGAWIAVGKQSAAISRDNGHTWDSLASLSDLASEVGWDSFEFSSITQDGKGTWVVTGYLPPYDDIEPFYGYIFTSFDNGNSWSRAVGNGGYLGGVFDVEHDQNGNWVAVGPHFSVTTSGDNARSWTFASKRSNEGIYLSDVETDGKELWIALSGDGGRQSSDNGKTWEPLIVHPNASNFLGEDDCWTLPDALCVSFSNVSDVVHKEGFGWLLLGNLYDLSHATESDPYPFERLYWYSVDGVDWDVFTPKEIFGTELTPTVVPGSDGVWIGVGLNGFIARSPAIDPATISSASSESSLSSLPSSSEIQSSSVQVSSEVSSGNSVSSVAEQPVSSSSLAISSEPATPISMAVNFANFDSAADAVVFNVITAADLLITELWLTINQTVYDLNFAGQLSGGEGVLSIALESLVAGENSVQVLAVSQDGQMAVRELSIFIGGELDENFAGQSPLNIYLPAGGVDVVNGNDQTNIVVLAGATESLSLQLAASGDNYVFDLRTETAENISALQHGSDLVLRLNQYYPEVIFPVWFGEQGAVTVEEIILRDGAFNLAELDALTMASAPVLNANWPLLSFDEALADGAPVTFNVVEGGGYIATAEATFSQSSASQDVISELVDNIYSTTFTLVEPTEVQAQSVTFTVEDSLGLASQLQATVIAGTVAADTLRGSNSVDLLLGGDGDDSLQGNAGNDLLVGGHGADSLNGGLGDDQFYFALGDGADSITATAETRIDKNNRLVFANDIQPADIRFSRVSNQLVLRHVNDGDQVTIADFFQGDDIANQWNPVQNVLFSDGTIWSATYLQAQLLAASDLDDNVRATYADDQLTLGDGNDIAYGALGNDVLAGEAGNDTLYGNDGNDELLGGTGNDTLHGQMGDDQLFGGAGNDTLNGDAGSDILYGNEGDDSLQGGAGDDTYHFGLGDGNDVIQALFENRENKLNTLLFSEGISPADIQFWRSNSNLVLMVNGFDRVTIESYFREDDTANLYNPVQIIRFNDEAQTEWGIDYFWPLLFAANDKDQTTLGSFDADEIFGGKGDDSLNGKAGDDVIEGGEGNDMLTGDAGADTLYGNAGKDTLNGGNDNDQLFGGEGDDALIAGAGDDVLAGGPGNDTLQGNQGDDLYSFELGDGFDVIQQHHENRADKLNVLQFGEGILPEAITFWRSGANLVLQINAFDRITIEYYFYEDNTANLYNPVQIVRFSDAAQTEWDIDYFWPLLFSASDADQTTLGSNIDDEIFGGAGDDALNGNAGNDSLYGDAGNDMLTGEEGADLLHGGDGKDSLSGGNDNDELFGGEGDDILTGGTGNDHLSGGPGNDRLQGNNGDDTFYFNLGDGFDVVEEYPENRAGKLNVLQFGEGIAPSDVLFTRSGASLVLRVNASDRVTIQYYFYEDNTENLYNPVQLIRFSDEQQTEWATDYFWPLLFTADNNDQTVEGSALDDVMAGGSGDDNLSGQAGDDIIQGNDGNDVITGDTGNDELHGGNGKDNLNGGADDDLLFGEAGNDSLTGGAGNDALSGGPGNDTLQGNMGDDVFYFNVGDGADVIEELYENRASKLNVLQFGEGILPNEITFWRSGASLVLQVNAFDRVTVQYYFYEDDTQNLYNPVQVIRFSDESQTEWGTDYFWPQIFAANEADQTTLGSAGDDEIFGGAGDDNLDGNTGADTLDGGIGNDILTGDAGGDVLRGGAGKDTLNGGNDDDQLFGDAGNDVLNGGNGNDTLSGGQGNDTLTGGNGDDTYVFALGDGVDLIEEGYENRANKRNILQLGEGVAPSDVVLSQSGASLIVQVSTLDRITVQYFFYEDNTANLYNPVQIIRFSDEAATEWDASFIADNLQVVTVVEPLSLTGTADADTLEGGAGNDNLSGGAGNDLLIGGLGNDNLNGGAGDDTYQFNLGDGHDTIAPTSEVREGKRNVLLLGAGLLPGETSFIRNGNDLELRFISGDRITVRYMFLSDDLNNDSSPVQEIVFSDETVWTPELILSALLEGSGEDDVVDGSLNADVMAGLAGDDTLRGGAGDDEIDGGDGNDNLSGEAGSDRLTGGLGKDTLNGGADDDVLEGGAGNDTLAGGAGNDILVGGTGDDSIDGDAGDDIYRFNVGDGHDTIQPVSEAREGKNNILELGVGFTSEDTYFTRNANDLELWFATGDRITVRYMFLNDDTANEYNPLQTIMFADETSWTADYIWTVLLAGTDNDDTIDGSFEEDVITGFGGDDTLRGGAGDDRLDGGIGNDNLSGEAGIDQLFGDAGKDTLNGGADDDLLDGGEGDDRLDGGLGNDVLTGGLGDDTIDGGRGDDRYQFNVGDGHDTIAGVSEVREGKRNILQLGEGFAASETTFTRSGNSLELQFASGDRITVQQFFLSDDTSNEYNPVQEIHFADETIWDAAFVWATLAAGTDKNDTVHGSFEADMMFGLAGDDSLHGAAGDDVINGGDGNDNLLGEAGIDHLIGGIGKDTLNGGNDDDLLQGGEGDDTLLGANGNDILEGGPGNDSLDGGRGDDIYQFHLGDGHDTIQGMSEIRVGKLNTLELGEGLLAADTRFTRSGNSLELWFATGDRITVQLYFLSDDTNNEYNPVQEIHFADETVWTTDFIWSVLLAGTGNDDTIDGSLNADVITGMLGDDVLRGGASDDELDGGEGNDNLSGEAGNDHLIGGLGNDTLNGGNDNDLLEGGEGSDALNGGNGNDTLIGGSGNDSLDGGRGDDTYQFNVGDGADTIVGVSEVRVGKLNVLQLGEGIDPASTRVVRDNGYLRLVFATGDQIAIQHYFLSNDTNNEYNPVQQILFADDTQWLSTDIWTLLLAGTDGDDTIIGSIDDDVITGLDGNDTLSGAEGDDTIHGGLLDDILNGNDGEDTLFGEAGNDQLNGGAANDALYGGVGNDILTGGAGNDLLEGGPGNDTLEGGLGDDTFVYALGDGSDIIELTDDNRATKANRLVLDASINQEDLTLLKSGMDLVIRNRTNDDQITVRRFFLDTNNTTRYAPVQIIQMPDGSEWDMDQVMATVAM